jgi:predicted dehydrogenase
LRDQIACSGVYLPQRPPEAAPDSQGTFMSILSSLGLTSGRKVRYGVVALGDIAQEAMLPGIAHTGNSEVTAFVTGDPEKARSLGARYGVTDTYSYDQFETMLASGKVDAIYLSTPNWRHAEFIIPALKAGIHVLAEKPLEVSTEKAQAILDAERASAARLMVAYRLHFEPSTLAMIERIRAGDIGDVILFSSIFGQMVDPENHRAKNGDLAGPIFDMGPYPINAARYVFGAEPTEIVSAVGTRHPEAGLGDFDDTVAVTLRFPGDRLAQFVLSYVTNTIDTYTAIGTKGSIQMDPGFMYGMSLEQNVVIGESREHHSFKNTDHFGGEMKYFSDCILNDRDPEPDGEEGFADVRVIEGILAALKSGTSQALPPFTRSKRIDPASQLQKLAAQSTPELVHASSPAKGKDRAPKN